MATEATKMLYRDALDLYRTVEKIQSRLVLMFNNEFLELGEDEERRVCLGLAENEDVPI